MKNIKQKALENTAKTIEKMDNNVLAMEEVSKDAVCLHRQARLALWNILDINGYSLSQTYKLIKNGKKD